jgi:Ca2+-binding EF-hand superfamily protein
MFSIIPAELNAGIPRENAIVESFFATFDHDRSGDIDFCEFVGALSLLCSAVPLPQRTQRTSILQSCIFSFFNFSHHCVLQ